LPFIAHRKFPYFSAAAHLTPPVFVIVVCANAHKINEFSFRAAVGECERIFLQEREGKKVVSGSRREQEENMTVGNGASEGSGVEN
jgi:hypothetical protein